MRILFAHNYYRQAGGEDAVVEQEMTLLKRAGHDVELYALDNAQIKGISDQIKTVLDVANSETQRDKILQIIDQKKPDVVHVHNFFPLLTPALYDACREKHVPVVQTLHNYRVMCAGALLLRKGIVCEKCIKGSPYWGAVHRCYRSSFFGTLAVSHMISVHRKEDTWSSKIDCVIALTEFSRSKYIEAGIDPSVLTVKPNFIEDPMLDKVIPGMDNRDGVLFVGRLSEEKGISTLIEAWRDLDMPLTVAGDGPCRELVQSVAGKKIRFLGSLSSEQVSTEMQKARLLIMPSIWYEGFPMVLLESFAHGLPVLGARIGSVGQIIDKHEAGQLFVSGDSDDLCRQVVDLYNNKDQLQYYSEKSRKAYEDEYSSKQNLRMLEDIYSGLIEKNKSRG